MPKMNSFDYLKKYWKKEAVRSERESTEYLRHCKNFHANLRRLFRKVQKQRKDSMRLMEFDIKNAPEVIRLAAALGIKKLTITIGRSKSRKR